MRSHKNSYRQQAYRSLKQVYITYETCIGQALNDGQIKIHS